MSDDDDAELSDFERGRQQAAKDKAEAERIRAGRQQTDRARRFLARRPRRR